MLPSSSKTKGTRIVDTVQFPPSKTAMSHTSSKDMASIAALKLSNELQWIPLLPNVTFTLNGRPPIPRALAGKCAHLVAETSPLRPKTITHIVS
jgi:hypothetical protein